MLAAGQIDGHAPSAMSLVGISNKRTRRGIRSPGFAGETWDWRDPAGSTGNTGRARAGYRVMTVIDALSTASDLGAYMVPYSLVDPDGNALGMQPRVSVDALPWLRGLGFALRASCLFVDVDNPNRRPWTTEDRERAHVEHALIPMLATVGVCATPYGRRLIQPLDRALDVETFARVARSFALALDLAGVIGVDHRCADWTRHYRLQSGPRMALRDEPGWLDLSRMTPIAPPTPVAAIPRRQKAPRGTIGYVAPVEPTWSTAVAHRYRPMVADLADAVVAFTGDARALLRAVGGALCERGVPVEHVPRLVEGVSIEGLRSARGDTAFDDALRTGRLIDDEQFAVRHLAKACGDRPMVTDDDPRALVRVGAATRSACLPQRAPWALRASAQLARDDHACGLEHLPGLVEAALR